MKHAWVIAAALAAAATVRADDWSGPYVGASGGLRFLRADWTTTSYQNPNGGALPFASSPKENLDATSAFAGPYAGYMMRVRESWVVGLEGDWSWADNGKAKQFLPGADNSPTPTGTVETGVDDVWAASVRLRAGYLVTPETLVYLTGGLAFQRTTVFAASYEDTNVTNPAFGPQYIAATRTREGWTAGLGVERKVADHLLARIEYRYAAFGTESFTTFNPDPSLSFGVAGNVQIATQTISAGLAYKF